MSAATCEATVNRDWSSYPCRKPGTAVRCHRTLCTIHTKQFDKWVDDPTRDAPGMAEFWWGWGRVEVSQTHQTGDTK